MSGLDFAGSGRAFPRRLASANPPMAVFVPLADKLSSPISFPCAPGDLRGITLRVDSPPIRTLIVDDEPVARQVLRDELGAFSDVKMAEIVRLKPDLVFLDLQMPGMGGFDVIRQLPEGALPIVVIVTAYDEHAIRAFEAGALDYLLKPVSQERLEKALDRARALRGRSREVAESLAHLSEGTEAPGAPRGRKVVGRTGTEYYLLDLDDVLAFQAEREIVWILTARQRYMATQTLRAVDERLRGAMFQRVHRNALVNVNHVRKMSPLSSQRWLLTLSNGLEFIVSKRQASTVRRMLQW
jgi:DNA-binding LytR/AlgR family response regulator